MFGFVNGSRIFNLVNLDALSLFVTLNSTYLYA